MIHKFIIIVSSSMVLLNVLRAMSGEVVYEQLILSSVLFLYSLNNAVDDTRPTTQAFYTTHIK